jgi:hypothetical protein
MTFLFLGRQLHGHWKLVGTNITVPAAVKDKCPLPVSNCVEPWGWSGPPWVIMDTVIRGLRPTDVILSRGWAPFSSHEVNLILNSSFVRQRKANFYFKGYTKIKSTSHTWKIIISTYPKDHLASEMFRSAGWKVLDAYNFTQVLVNPLTDYADLKHFLCPTYNSLNLYLLQLLNCSRY